MATVTKPIALDESFNTTELTPRNIADVLAQELSRITGRNASQVEYDNTESGLTADNVQDAIDELKSDIPTVNDGTLTIQQNGEAKGTFTANQSGNSTVNIEIPTTDIQTAVDEFSTYNGGILDSLKVTLSPNQDLHGYDSPWVGGAGKNKFNGNFLQGYWAYADGIWNDSPTWITTEKIPCKPSTNYTTSSSPHLTRWQGFVWYDANGNYISTDNFEGSMNVGLTRISPSNASFLVFDIAGQNLDSKISPTDVQNFQIEEGITATSYEPYSNICPIAGRTQVDVDVSDGQTTQEQVTVNLGDTYYSGTLDVVSGELTVDSAFIASYNGETLPSTWISDRDVYAVGTTPTTGAEVCYKLATPTPIQLSPTMVKTLVGENHLSAPLDGQEITESKYKQLFTFDDVIAYIQSLS